MTEKSARKNPFAVGDIVYIIGKYMPSAESPLLLMECEISHIEHRQFVAFRTDGEVGKWMFSQKDFNKCVFKDREKAEAALKERS